MNVAIVPSRGPLLPSVHCHFMFVSCACISLVKSCIKPKIVMLPPIHASVENCVMAHVTGVLAYSVNQVKASILTAALHRGCNESNAIAWYEFVDGGICGFTSRCLLSEK